MLVRKSEERGKNNIAWLKANHTFSFGHYRDPKWTNFHNLLVINEDTIAPAMGFGAHPHDNMEIITYVIDGEIKHRDSMGSNGIIKPGEIQVMSAGTGVAHSEYNNLQDKPTHLLQIWILPDKENIEPRYDQQRVINEADNNFLKVIAGKDAAQGTMQLNAEAHIWVGRYDHEDTVKFEPKEYNNFWIQMVKGSVNINAEEFSAGDGIAFSDVAALDIHIKDIGAEFLILELKG